MPSDPSTESERYRRGLRRLNEVDGEQVRRIVSALEDIAPDFAGYAIEFAFGDIYARPRLDLKTRQIHITLSDVRAPISRKPPA